MAKAVAERRAFPLSTGVAEVVGVERITPAMARVKLAAEALVGFPCEEPGEIVTLLWPEPGQELILPEVGWRFPPGVADRQHARNYTVRYWDAEEGEVDVDFFLHGVLGRAAEWAENVTLGDTVGFAGPRTHWVGDDSYDWSVLAGDETGLPAIAAILETLPAGHHATAVLEVDNRDERQTIETDADVELQWVYRNGAAPGTVHVLPEAVAALDLPGRVGDGTRGRVFGATEAGIARIIRDHAKGECGLPSDCVDVLGYWKHRKTRDWE